MTERTDNFSQFKSEAQKFIECCLEVKMKIVTDVLLYF